jgi:hypothetical protein
MFQLPVQGILLANDRRPLRMGGRRRGHSCRSRVFHVLMQEEFVFLRDITNSAMSSTSTISRVSAGLRAF